MTGYDSSKVPDIYLEKTQQSLDYTCKVNPKAAYSEKIKKYADLQKPVIPIVVTPQLCIHKESSSFLSKNCKNYKQTLKELAYWISNLETEKMQMYHKFSKTSN